MVPDNWIFGKGNQKRCRWTATRTHVKEAHAANPNWKIYDIVRFHGQKHGKLTNVIFQSFSLWELRMRKTHAHSFKNLVVALTVTVSFFCC